MADSNFVDYVKIYCRSGKGGRGSMHLRHVKYNPNGLFIRPECLFCSLLKNKIRNYEVDVITP